MTLGFQLLLFICKPASHTWDTKWISSEHILQSELHLISHLSLVPPQALIPVVCCSNCLLHIDISIQLLSLNNPLLNNLCLKKSVFKHLALLRLRYLLNWVLPYFLLLSPCLFGPFPLSFHIYQISVVLGSSFWQFLPCEITLLCFPPIYFTGIHTSFLTFLSPSSVRCFKEKNWTGIFERNCSG